MAPSIKPFSIAVPDAELEKLKTKLSVATLPDEVDFTDDLKYGASLTDIRRLVSYWQDGYDWRKNEASLNKEASQYTTDINVDGFGDVNIHFVHAKSDKSGSIPLLFVHGWPGGFWEAHKIIPLLVKGDTQGSSFHVVAPSLPNFGFSAAIRKPGFAIAQYAEVCHKLMLQLGYEKYATQGGDWGTMITRIMGVHYPSHLIASHLSMPLVMSPPKFTEHPLLYLQSLLPLSPAEKGWTARAAWFQAEGSGYSKLQTTRPHTLGFLLADSPVGLLAWILEKLQAWTDDYPWTDDEILTWVSLYQFSRAGPDAASRIYYEVTHAADGLLGRGFGYNGAVKLGLSYFPKELVLSPLAWGRTLGPIVLEEVHGRGGHFAAFEVPEVLVGDLRKMFSQKGLTMM